MTEIVKHNERLFIMNIGELIQTIEEMKDNTSISIAADYDMDSQSASGWWSIAKLNYADSKTLIFNYYGGGSPYAYPIEADEVYNTVKFAVQEFLSNCPDFGIGKHYCISKEVLKINAD